MDKGIADNTAVDEKANLEQLRLLCIRTEIATDTESPKSDKQLRMEYQVNLLQQGIGSAHQLNNARVELAHAWAAVGPVEMDRYEALFQRFDAAWRKLK